MAHLRYLRASLFFFTVAAVILIVILTGCSTADGIQSHEATLYLATAADLITTQEGLDRGMREANPVLAPILDAGGILTLALVQIGINEAALSWERKACKAGRGCKAARFFRRSLTGVHAAAAGWNLMQLRE